MVPGEFQDMVSRLEQAYMSTTRTSGTKLLASREIAVLRLWRVLWKSDKKAMRLIQHGVGKEHVIFEGKETRAE